MALGPGLERYSKIITDWLTASATVALAIGLIYAAKSYYSAEKTRHLQWSLQLIADSYKVVEDNREGMFTKFKDRYPLKGELSTKDAAVLVAHATQIGTPEYETWNVAREHLNELEPFAFAYYYDVGDREVLAAFACARLSRSYRYFRSLINAIREADGTAQSWQIIGPVVRHMEKVYGPECKQLQPTTR